MEILTIVKDTPIPTILVAAGVFFLLSSILAQRGWKIKMSSKRQKVFIALGGILLLFGISLYLLTTLFQYFGKTSPPTIMGVVIRKNLEEGEVVISQEINFYDEDGNTNLVEWDLVDLSDPSQREYMQLQNGAIDDLPAVQKIRSTAKRIWRCEGHTYVATLEVSLLDRDGNRSEPVRYTIECAQE